jgi:GrpB-like predicted nucleotidyltransferase (UPF0157 family)
MPARLGEAIQIVDYDPAWETEFARLRLQLLNAVKHLAVTVEHVGSTAVPGLAAKPILDIDVVLNASHQLSEVIVRLAEIGYHHQGDLGITGREAFASPSNTPAHHLYVVVRGSEPWRNHVLFRDYLREHPERAHAYATLKRSLAERFRNDREKYTEGKTEFITRVLRRAANT